MNIIGLSYVWDDSDKVRDWRVKWGNKGGKILRMKDTAQDNNIICLRQVCSVDLSTVNVSVIPNLMCLHVCMLNLPAGLLQGSLCTGTRTLACFLSSHIYPPHLSLLFLERLLVREAAFFPRASLSRTYHMVPFTDLFSIALR